MKRWLILPLVLLVSAPAWAQQPPAMSAPPYAPITINEAAYKEITGWLLDQPAKFSIPVLQWLEAQQRAAAAVANKPKDPAKLEAPKKPD